MLVSIRSDPFEAQLWFAILEVGRTTPYRWARFSAIYRKLFYVPSGLAAKLTVNDVDFVDAALKSSTCLRRIIEVDRTRPKTARHKAAFPFTVVKACDLTEAMDWLAYVQDDDLKVTRLDSRDLHAFIFSYDAHASVSFKITFDAFS